MLTLGLQKPKLIYTDEFVNVGNKKLKIRYNNIS